MTVGVGYFISGLLLKAIAFPSKNEVVLAQDKLLDQLQVVADKYNAAQDQLDDADLMLTQLIFR